MIHALYLAAAFIALPVVRVVGQVCGPGAPCPSTTSPCCSEYGFCGSGSSYCRGGCDPLWSNALTSCELDPICQSANYTFADTSRIYMTPANFTNNATAYDWTLDEGSIMPSNGSDPGELLLILTETNGGTRISTTRYIQYGTITARLKTGRWAGVVTAFITMSDVKDEIDWEWPGNTTTEAQSNYYWLGVANYSATHGATALDISDTYENYHDYTLDWQPNQLQWLIDGTVVRTLNKTDTMVTDSLGSRYEYPSTPSRVQISLWPAGISTSAAGTVSWAGGMIDWTDPDYVAAGYFSAVISSVSITCSPQAPTSPGAQSYMYSGNDSTGVPQVTLVNTTSVIVNTTTSTSGAKSWTPGNGWRVAGAMAVAAGSGMLLSLLSWL